MAESPTQLKRGLFGYSRRSVMEALVERDGMLGRTQQHLTMAEAELARSRAIIEALRGELGDRTRRAKEDVERLERELEQARSEAAARSDEAHAATARVAQLEGEVEQLRQEIQRLENERVTIQQVSDGGDFAADELARVLATTEQAVAAIFERARHGNEERLREIERAREELHGEMEQVRRWRDEVSAVMRSVQDSAAHARSQVEQTPGRLREALSPTTEAMTSVNDWLGELIRVMQGLDAGGSSNPPAVASTADPTELGPAPNNGTGPTGDHEDEGLPAHFRWQ
jgi:chromosome segregation ATPase